MTDGQLIGMWCDAYINIQKEIKELKTKKEKVPRWLLDDQRLYKKRITESLRELKLIK
jgi:hypothetical protein